MIKRLIQLFCKGHQYIRASENTDCWAVRIFCGKCGHRAVLINKSKESVVGKRKNGTCDNFKLMKSYEHSGVEAACAACAKQYLDGCPKGAIKPQGG